VISLPALLMSLVGPSEPRPQVPSLGTVVRLLNDAVENRIALAGVELDETKVQASVSAMLIGVVALLVNLAGFAFTLMAAALVWDSAHRGAWLAGLGGLYGLAAAAVGYVLWRRLRAWQPFAETKSQLTQDQQCLKALTKSILN
jgi:uncharacterized membrane protein YqjE